MRLIIIIFFINAFCIKAQEWAPIGATWYYNYDISEGWFGLPGTQFSVFESVSDTIIDGISCRKITKSKDYTPFEQTNIEYTYYSNDSVYFYNLNFSEFQLLYNFNASQGDFWFYKFYGDNFVGDIDTIKTVVDSTSMVNINGTNLKLLYVHYEPLGFEYDWMYDDYEYSYKSEIIEFIGDKKNLINTYFIDGIIFDANCPSGLRCYTDNFIGHYETGLVDSCDWVDLLSINNFENQLYDFYPNPSTGIINFSESFRSFYVVNTVGEIVYFSEFNSSQTIDLTFLEDGIYYLKITNMDAKSYVQKLIIHH